MKFFKYSLLFTLLMCFVSCESLIDEKVYSFKSKDNAFVTETDALTGITGAYLMLDTYLLYSQSYWRVVETAGGGITRPKQTVGADDVQLIQKAYTSTNNLIDNVWTGHYLIINSCNDLLENFSKMNIQADVKNSVTGEALFLRSMHYFNLVRMWGGVPLRLDPTTGPGNAYTARSSEEVVYKQIILDLKLAASLLPVTQTLKGRVTKGAAYALLGKVYLTLGSMKKYSGNIEGRFNFVVDANAMYDSTRTYCKKVVDLGIYSLPDDYATQFSISGKNSTESIFEVQFSSGLKGAGSQMPPYTCPYMSGASFGLGYGTHRLTQKQYNDFNGTHPGDYRLESSIFGGFTFKIPKYDVYHVQYKTGVATTDSMFIWPYPAPKRTTYDLWPFLAKFQDSKATAMDQHGSNFIYLRYADLLLMYAEAENEINGPDNAYKYINAVLQRARKANGIAREEPKDFTNLSQDELRLAIWKERRYELMGEAHLWYDLIRTGQYQTYISEYNATDGADLVYQQTMINDIRNILFPIPYSELNRNNLITQNKGHI